MEIVFNEALLLHKQYSLGGIY